MLGVEGSWEWEWDFNPLDLGTLRNMSCIFSNDLRWLITTVYSKPRFASTQSYIQPKYLFRSFSDSDDVNTNPSNINFPSIGKKQKLCADIGDSNL